MYDALAAYYDLIYPDWEETMRRQGEALSLLLHPESRVLDVAAGIGTQTLPLAASGFDVVARDLSEGAIARLLLEASQRGLQVDADAADMRRVGRSVEGRFDAVVALDNALPHLLTDEAILEALVGFRALLKPDGFLLLSVRDYDTVDRAPHSTHPYGTRTRRGRTYRLSQEWRWIDSDRYRTTMIVEEERRDGWQEVVRGSSRYYAVSVNRLLELCDDAGFEAELVSSEGFFQPLVRGRPR